MSIKATSVNKLAAFTKRVVTIEASTVETPANVTDYTAQFKKQSGSRLDVSNEFTADFFPDSVPNHIFMTAMMSKYFDSIEKIKHAKLTNATMGFYNSCIYYGFFLLNDAFVRPQPSIFAQQWKQFEHMSDFLDVLLGLPVPSDFDPMFMEFFATETETRGHIHIIPSAAGYEYKRFYGKIIVPMYYLAIHNTIASIAATTVTDITKKLCTTPLYTINNVKSTTNYVHTPLDVLGGTYSTTDEEIQFPDSKWYQCHDTTYNPVLSRSYQRREYLAKIPFEAPEFESFEHVNPYTLCFSNDRATLSEFTIVLQKIASLIKGVIPYSKTLSGIIAEGSGIGILRHGYSGYMLPIMTHDRSTVKNVKDIVTRKQVTFAQNCKFLSPPEINKMTKKAMTVPHPIDPSGSAIDKKTASIFGLWTTSLWRMQENPSSTPTPEASEFIKFDKNVHLYPKTLVMDITGTQTVDAYKATMHGKVIESYEIDGFSVPQPNPENALGVENSFFLDSFVPYNLVQPRTSFYETNAKHIFALKRTRVEEQSQHPASGLLVDRTRIPIATYQNDLFNYVSGHFFPGLTPISNVNWQPYMWRFFGYTSNDTSKKANLEIPGLTNGSGVPDRFLLCWSPYTFTAVEPKLSYDPANQTFDSKRSYFIMNWRTIFGTDKLLVEVKNVYDSMPAI